jgi:hypothetical protein
LLKQTWMNMLEELTAFLMPGKYAIPMRPIETVEVPVPGRPPLLQPTGRSGWVLTWNGNSASICSRVWTMGNPVKRWRR